MRTFFIASLLTLSACSGSDDPNACEADSYNCDGTILQECGSDGLWADKEDCADLGMMCHAEMGHCMAMDDDTGTDDE